MKKLLIFMIIFCLVFPPMCFGGPTSYNLGRKGSPITSDWWSSGRISDIGTNWAREIDSLIALGINPGTGQIFYVDSGVTNAGDGSNWLNALATVDEAINLCTANRGDWIAVAQGHAETIAAANGWDADIAGITIWHLGNGSNQGTYTFTAGGSTVAVGAANVLVKGGRFLAGISEVVVGISVEAAGNYFTLCYAEFPEPTTSTFEFNIAIQLTTASDDVTITRCKAYSADATGADHWLNGGAGVLNRLTVTHNLVIGEFAIAPIFSDQVDLENHIAYNSVTNMTSAQHGIEFSANATGWLIGNTVSTDALATSYDPGRMGDGGGNMWDDFDTYDTTGVAWARPETGVNQLNATTITAIGSGLTGVGFRATTEANVGGTAEFTAIGLAAFGNDYFNTGWSVICVLNADAPGTVQEGEIRDITDYISTTGVFTVDAAFSAAVTTGDGVYVRRNEELNFDDPALAGSSGNIWYCDDGGSNGDGTTWQTAKTTVKAAEALMSAGDKLYIGANHNENILTADAVTFNVAGTIIEGMGDGDAKPLFDMDDDGTMFTVDAAVTIRNIRIRPGITACNIGIFFEDDSDGSVLEDVDFVDGEAAGTDEFTDAIVVDTVAVGITINRCTIYNTDAPGTFVNLDEATIANATVTNCTVFGAFSEAPIWGETAVPTNLNIHSNTINNTSSGNLCIEFTGNATGSCTNNFLSGDTVGSILASGLMRVSGNTQTVAADAAAIEVPLVIGKTYTTTWAEALYVSDDAWVVAGGPILVTNLIGQIVTAYDGRLDHTWWCDATTAAQDVEFTDTVDIDAYLIGERIIFSNANPAAIANLTSGTTNGGASSLMSPWFCPVGTIETLIENPAAAAGDITWYMTFIPLTDGVTVVSQ